MRIRAATSQDLPEMARVNVDTRRPCYSGFYPKEILDRMSYEGVENAWRQVLFESGVPQSNFAYVAEDITVKVIAILISGPEQTGDVAYQGEIYVLYVLPAYQKRGIGRALVRAAVQKFLERNITGLLIWVLEQNPSRAFYEALGGKVVRTKEVQIDGTLPRAKKRLDLTIETIEKLD